MLSPQEFDLTLHKIKMTCNLQITSFNFSCFKTIIAVSITKFLNQLITTEANTPEVSHLRTEENLTFQY